jgi:hypothetical protein
VEVTTQRLSAVISAAAPIDGVSIATRGAARIDFKDAATGPERIAAEAALAAFDWSVAADDTWLAQQRKIEASASFDRGDTRDGAASDRVVVALAELMLDEFNAHSTVEAAMFAAVAAASSLADLKTRYAAIVKVPQRTRLQVINAIKAKIAATAE